MANRNITLKRNNAGTTEELYPTTDWSQVNSKPSTFTPTAHSHGNITNGGAITANATIATGDHLVIADNSASNTLTTSSITFDTTNTSTFLRRDGTWSTVEASGNQFVNTTGDTMTGNLSIENGGPNLTLKDTTDSDDISFHFKNSSNTVVGAITTAGNQLNIETSFANGLEFDAAKTIISGGNVGIGTTNPKTKLNVASGTSAAVTPTLGSAENSSAIFTNSVNAYGLNVMPSGSGDVHLQVQRFDASTSVYDLNLQPSGGNVGIGTTSPGSPLTVAGTIESLPVSSSEGGDLRLRAATGKSYQYTIDNYNDTLRFIRQDDTTGSSGQVRMLIDSSGKVGIGTASPTEKLTVYGDSNTSENSPVTFIKHNFTGTHGFGLSISRDNSDTAALALGSNSSNHGIVVANAADLILGTITSGVVNDAINVKTSGNVGIGTTTPGEKLEVNGKIKVNNEVIATKLVDYNNGNYYVDPASTSNINNLTVQGNLTVNGTTTTLDTTVSTTDQWTVTNAGTDVATIINQTGTADILDVRDNGTSVFKVKDGGNVEMKTDSKFTVGASTTVNEAKIILDASNAGHPQIGLAENNDASWALGVDDLDNSFKIHGAASSTIPTIGGLTTPHLELDTTGNMWLQKRLYFTSNAYMEYNSTNDSIDFFFT